MAHAILLTGEPGSGKTTLVRRAVERFPGEAGGFYTQELRVGGERQGFKIVTLDGREGILAQRGLPSKFRVGRYGVDLTALETIGIESLTAAAAANKLVVIDEIGPMEIYSERFCASVREILDRSTRVLGTIVKRPYRFADELKARRDVRVIEVTRRNFEATLERVLQLLKSESAP